MLKLTVLFLFCCSFNLYAKNKAYQLKYKTSSLSYKLPSGWKKAEGYLGVPLVLRGPKLNKETPAPIIMVAPLGVKNAKLKLRNHLNAYDAYKVGRIDWVKHIGGTILRFFPYIQKKTSHFSEWEQTGFIFRKNKQNIIKKSIYANCKKDLIHFKVSYSQKLGRSVASVTDEILRSFKCR